MKLHTRILGTGKPVIILHGLLGSSDNWQTFGKQLSDEGYRVIMADLRNHGLSPHDEEFNLALMATDVKELMDDLQLKEACVIGHSLGGKTAMQLAVTDPQKLKGLIVIDIAPRKYGIMNRDVIEALNEVDVNTVQSRQEAATQLEKSLPDKAVVQWLMKSLQRKENNHFQWRFNLAAITKQLGNTGDEIYSDRPVQLPTLFIKGEKSNYVSAKDELDIRVLFPNAALKTAPGAGHWVHAEAPQWLLDVTLEFLKKIHQNQ